MAEHGGGSIINTTSIGGINAGGGLMTYRAGKGRGDPPHPVDRDRAVAEHGIRVNCIAPAHIPTDINTYLDQSAIVRRCSRCSAWVRRPTSPKPPCTWRATESAQVTGIVLPVDGGTTAGRPMVKFEDVAARPDTNAK